MIIRDKRTIDHHYSFSVDRSDCIQHTEQWKQTKQRWFEAMNDGDVDVDVVVDDDDAYHTIIIILTVQIKKLKKNYLYLGHGIPL